jgi:hypothetical protein
MKELEITEKLHLPLDPSQFTPKSDLNQNEVREEKISMELDSEETESENLSVERKRRTPAEWFRKYFLEGLLVL